MAFTRCVFETLKKHKTALQQHHTHHTPTPRASPYNPHQTILTPTPQVHKLCQEAAQQILDEFKPTLMIAIGGGGYVPARILRYALHSLCSNLF